MAYNSTLEGNSDRIMDNENMFRKFVAETLARTFNEEPLIEKRIVFLARNVSILYAEKTATDFEVVYPLVKAFFDAMESEK